MDDITPAVAAKAIAAGAPLKKAIAGDKQVFDMNAEANATAHGKTTLTDEQTKQYKQILELVDQAATPGTTGWKDDAAGRKAYGELKKELSGLSGEESAPVVGRLLYHAAHAPMRGEGLMADVLAFSPEAKNLEFIGQKSKEPVSLKQIMQEGIAVGHNADVPPENGWVADKAQVDANRIAAQNHQVKQPQRER